MRASSFRSSHALVLRKKNEASVTFHSFVFLFILPLMILTKQGFVHHTLSRKRFDSLYVPRECFLTVSMYLRQLRATFLQRPLADARTLNRTAQKLVQYSFPRLRLLAARHKFHRYATRQRNRIVRCLL
jgi:hypothetical protein